MSSLFPYTVQDTKPQVDLPWNIKQINAPSFWKETKGGGAVVAVVDTGLDINHKEFSGRIYKPLNLTFKAEPQNLNDKIGHGTHVAGIIGGTTCGVAPEVRIMPLKVFPDSSRDYNVDLYIQEAFKVIVDHNKACAEKDKVVAVNCSFGGAYYDPMTAYFIRTLVSQGVTVVVAAGNAGDGDPSTHEVFSYPAFIWECLTVGATDEQSKSAGYSNSFDGIDIGAPGTDIYSAFPGNVYKKMSGTSMSAPHVTGAVALIYDLLRKRYGKYPSEEEVAIAVLKHIRKVNLDPFFVGEGILDMTFNLEKFALWHVQTGAFYNKIGALKREAEVKACKFNTFLIKY